MGTKWIHSFSLSMLKYWKGKKTLWGLQKQQLIRIFHFNDTVQTISTWSNLLYWKIGIETYTFFIGRKYRGNEHAFCLSVNNKKVHVLIRSNYSPSDRGSWCRSIWLRPTMWPCCHMLWSKVERVHMLWWWKCQTCLRVWR